MAIKITISSFNPPMLHKGKPMHEWPWVEIAENSKDAAARLNEYVKGTRSFKGPKGGFTEHHIFRAIQHVEDMPSISAEFKSGIKTKGVKAEYSEKRPTARPISVHF